VDERICRFLFDWIQFCRYFLVIVISCVQSACKTVTDESQSVNMCVLLQHLEVTWDDSVGMKLV